MYEDFIAGRLSQLRQSKGVSARDMSLSIGQNTNYVNHIENRKMLPSMQAFFYICEYLNITPQEFFDVGNIHPERLNNVTADLKKLDVQTMAHIEGILGKLARSPTSASRTGSSR
jgi:transcriptional regulator with XRE-family HTH domain